DDDVFVERWRRTVDPGYVDIHGRAGLPAVAVATIHDPVIFDDDVGYRTAFTPAAFGAKLDGRTTALLDGIAGDTYPVGFDEVSARQMATHRIVGDFHGRPAGFVGEE